MWSNFHSHSRYCDGTGELSEYLTEAVANGVTSLGFSSHAPVPFDCTWCMKKENVKPYLDNIERLKAAQPSLQVYKGMEVDYIPGTVSPSDFRPLLDYTIGSIHFIDRFPDGKPWEIDGAHSVFLSGLESIFGSDIRAAVTRYFELTREMISNAAPDVIGHLDKIKVQNPANKFFDEADQWYRQEVIKTLDALAGREMIVEVNTRGLYQKKSATPYPSPWILEEILRRNIAITLSSDAHHAKDLLNQFEQTATLLVAIGFRKISILRDGSWQPVTLTPDGIVY
jgi:histidinol-phosphatase (PHP family)